MKQGKLPLSLLTGQWQIFYRVINCKSAYYLNAKGDEEYFDKRFEDVSNLFRIGKVAQEEMVFERRTSGIKKSEKTSESHDAQSARLKQQKDDCLSRAREMRCGVYHN